MAGKKLTDKQLLIEVERQMSISRRIYDLKFEKSEAVHKNKFDKAYDLRQEELNLYQTIDLEELLKTVRKQLGK